MRLFIAINFDEDVINELVRLQKNLKDSGAEGNFTKTENLHLTLAFIGEYGNPDDVLDILEDVEFKPVTLRYEGLQHFRDMYLARIKENHGLESYVKRLRRALAENDIPFDRKKFMPHITLIRKVSFKGGKLGEMPDYKGVGEIRVRKISLMSSKRGKNGMIYTEIGSVG